MLYIYILISTICSSLIGDELVFCSIWLHDLILCEFCVLNVASFHNSARFICDPVLKFCDKLPPDEMETESICYWRSSNFHTLTQES